MASNSTGNSCVWLNGLRLSTYDQKVTSLNPVLEE